MNSFSRGGKSDKQITCINRLIVTCAEQSMLVNKLIGIIRHSEISRGNVSTQNYATILNDTFNLQAKHRKRMTGYLHSQL
jgi:hypothetical protein